MTFLSGCLKVAAPRTATIFSEKSLFPAPRIAGVITIQLLLIFAYIFILSKVALPAAVEIEQNRHSYYSDQAFR
jgi:hypothetical protein